MATDGAGHNMIARNAAGDVVGLNFFPRGTISQNNQELFDLIGNALVGEVSLTVTVNNVAPTFSGVTLTPAVIDENDTVTLSGNIVDPGTLDTFTLVVDWGEGSPETFTYGAGTTSFNETHQYLDDDPSGTPSDVYPVSLTLEDDDGGTATGGGGGGGGSAVVGYYDMSDGMGRSTQVPPITTAGETPVQLTDLTASDLIGIDVLFVQNPSNSSYGSEYVSRLSSIQAAVNDGMVLIIHDRYVTIAETILPGGGGFDIRRDFGDDRDIDILDNTTLVTNGPGGVVTNTNLDGGTSSTHGFAVDGTLPPDAAMILSRSNSSEIVTFSYGYGAGSIVYSSIPLDFYLEGWGSTAAAANFRYIYAPNVVAYGASLRGAGLSVTVNNVAPQLSNVQVTSSVDENGTVSLSGDIVDPGTQDTFTLVMDWGEGAPETFTYGAGTTSFSETHQYLDDNPTRTASDTYNISLTLTDDDTGQDTGQVSTVVNNVDPLIVDFSSDATFDNKAAEDEPVTFTASFTDMGTLDTHTAEIDWGDGGLPEAVTVIQGSGSGTVTATHEYADGGVFVAKLTVTDDDTGTATATTTAVVTGARVHDGVLQIVGSDEADHVTVNQQGNGLLKVHADFFPEANFRRFTASDVTLIRMWLCSGDDHATVAGSVDTPAIIEGRQGNDHLNAGGGPTVLLGGPGDDMLIGGTARDLIIGGLGADRLIGGPEEDILIGGTTDYDSDPVAGTLANDAALLQILALWNGDGDFAMRQGILAAWLNELTVQDDREEDKFTGSSGEDWFFQGVDDVVTDGNSSSNGKGKGKGK